MDEKVRPDAASTTADSAAVPLGLPLAASESQHLPRVREKQIELDRYYMALAQTVETGADCLGTSVGAVLVVDDRVISTGYNGTPSGFQNCKEGGCVRCRDSTLIKQGRVTEATDPEHMSGKALDRCI